MATLTTPTPTLVPDLGKLTGLCPGGGDIWGKTLPEGEPQRLTGDGCNREPRWSPSAEWLAFRKGDEQVSVMRADRSATYLLADDPIDAEDRASLRLIPVAGGEPQQVVDELTPLPGPASSWFGYYGHVEWDVLFDWWRGPVPKRAQPQSTPDPRPQETATPPPAWATYTSLAFGVNSCEGRGKPSDLMRWSDEALDVELCLADHTWDNFCSSDPG